MSAAPMLDELEVARAQEYALLARLLLASPDAPLIAQLRLLRGDDSTLGRAHGLLADAAARTDATQAHEEYFRLFVGLGRGELLPYASYYRTGALHGRPLAELRATLASLGIARAAGESEPEDHAGILLEVMAGLVAGTLPAHEGADREFFTAHIAPWIGRFFVELETCGSAELYASVAILGRTFIEIERRAFLMQA